MNKYEYDYWIKEIDTDLDLFDFLNSIGEDGYHVYKQSEIIQGKVTIWACKKLSK